jgi:PadR family transcriptional regulator, regulatory protein PadR
MRRSNLSLSPLEVSALLALIDAGGESYGVPIHQRVSELEGRDTSIGAVYAALHRLLDKRLVTTWMGESSEARGGRAKKFFRLTADGYSAVDDVYRRAVSTIAILDRLDLGVQCNA